MSIKRKLLAVVSLLIFGSVMLVTLLTYRNDRQYLLEQSTETTQRLLEQLTLNTDTYLSELFRLCLSPYYNKRVMAQLESAPTTAAQRLAKQRVIEDYLGEVLTVPRSDILRAHILTDAVYSSSKTRYSADIAADYRSEGWYLSAIETDKPVFIPVHTEKQGKATLSVFSVVQKLRSTQDASKVLGVIRVDANFQGIKTVCDRVNIAESNALYLLDSAGNVIYEQNRLPSGVSLSDVRRASAQSDESSFSVTLGGETYVLNRRLSSATDWQLIDLHSMRSLTGTAILARDRAIGLAVLFAALGVAVTVVLLRLFLRPIFEVTGLMAKVQAGDLSVRAKVTGHDELTYLARSFNDMTAQIHDEMERNSLLTVRCTRRAIWKRRRSTRRYAVRFSRISCLTRSTPSACSSNAVSPTRRCSALKCWRRFCAAWWIPTARLRWRQR